MLRRAVATSALVLALLPGTAAQADETPSPSATPTPTPSPTPSPTPTTVVGATADTLAGLNAPVRDFSAGSESIITTVESIDGTETQEDTETRRTLILDSKVLFGEDRATLSPAARKRLRSVARQITDSSATGTVRVAGYTDDQGSAQHGLVLSRARAEAVRRVLTPLLAGAGVSIVTRGFGEADPRFPNRSKAGKPLPANQAKNRRVEITFSPAQD